VSGLRAARDENAALALSERALSAPDLARAESLLRRAAGRTPSTRPELRLAQLEAFAGRPAAARRIAEGIVRREPENAAAWRLLVEVAGDPARSAAARAEVEALSPAPDGR
jgi:predicted Zn-dependent protease